MTQTEFDTKIANTIKYLLTKFYDKHSKKKKISDKLFNKPLLGTVASNHGNLYTTANCRYYGAMEYLMQR